MLLSDVSVEELLKQAISKKVCVTANYNRSLATLAPHSIFTRHDELYLRAVTLDVDGRKPRQPKLGTFKLTGLTDLKLTRKLFSARSVFQGLEPQEGGDLLPPRNFAEADTRQRAE